MISAIAAMAKNRAIGVANDLPWDFPEDMKFFREKTKGSVMIMGRKTFDSFGGKPLPGRYHIVITRTPPASSGFENVVYVQTVDQAVSLARAKAADYQPEIFVIGGAEIYKQSLDQCDRIYLTLIDKDFRGDAFFPEFSDRKWQMRESRKSETTEELTFQIWDRAK